VQQTLRKSLISYVILSGIRERGPSMPLVNLHPALLDGVPVGSAIARFGNASGLRHLA